MGTIERVALAIVGVALATTLVLPERQTTKVIGAVSSLFRGSLATAMASPRR
jgi:hypothetical protein